ncbi:major capsid protein [Bifidobacterium platyrrhinorum]|uniref:Major capsid protein E n=1 Tax=Bifidobacterium platyrrhinorum TaxID=2661628 RepID=A0A6L9SSK3_9BIFI|nr:major capsid protein [Bifidobacterium platyrrhinorum]NEG55464.1 major capsid protein E [Bifidobacterium platyrrhinorum]
MALDKDIFPPSEATEVAQSGFDYVNGLTPFSKVFPMKSNDGEWVASWTPNLPTLATKAMQRRALDAEIGHTSMKSQTAEQHTGLIALSGKDHITERDMAKHANDKQFIHDTAELKTEHLGQTAGVTLELERINAMMNAKITVKENGLNVTYSFERPAKQHDQVPGVLWSDAKADPVADVQAWIETMRKNKGRVPHAVLTTSKVIDALRTNESFRTEISGMDIEHSKARLSRDEVLSVLATQLGLTEVRMIDLMYEDLELDGGFKMDVDTTTLIPDKTFIMFPSYNDATLGFTADGPTAEAQNSEFEINKTVNEGLIGALISHQAPSNYDIWVNGTALPILQDAVSTFKANVL